MIPRIRSIRINLKRWTRYARWGLEPGFRVKVFRTCQRLGPVSMCMDDWPKHLAWVLECPPLRGGKP